MLRLLKFPLLKASQKVFYLFLLISAIFVIGSIFNLNGLTRAANFLLVPSLLLYYRYKTKRWFLPMAVALFLLYIRDIFLLQGVGLFRETVLIFFFTAILILYIYAVTSFQKSKIYVVEVISLLIMYGFLGFLFFYVGELVPQVIPTHHQATYLYLFLPALLLAITFTQYLLKAHYASLWLMLVAASLLVSELSLFFKLHIISDVSVNLFYPLFHVLAYFAMVEHALHRRRSSRIPGFWSFWNVHPIRYFSSVY